MIPFLILSAWILLTGSVYYLVCSLVCRMPKRIKYTNVNYIEFNWED